MKKSSEEYPLAQNKMVFVLRNNGSVIKRLNVTTSSTFLTFLQFGSFEDAKSAIQIAFYLYFELSPSEEIFSLEPTMKIFEESGEKSNFKKTGFLTVSSSVFHQLK